MRSSCLAGETHKVLHEKFRFLVVVMSPFFLCLDETIEKIEMSTMKAFRAEEKSIKV